MSPLYNNPFTTTFVSVNNSNPNPSTTTVEDLYWTKKGSDGALSEVQCLGPGGSTGRRPTNEDLKDPRRTPWRIKQDFTSKGPKYAEIRGTTAPVHFNEGIWKKTFNSLHLRNCLLAPVTPSASSVLLVPVYLCQDQGLDPFTLET